jgi:hypothetical protein
MDGKMGAAAKLFDTACLLYYIANHITAVSFVFAGLGKNAAHVGCFSKRKKAAGNTCHFQGFVNTCTIWCGVSVTIV